MLISILSFCLSPADNSIKAIAGVSVTDFVTNLVLDGIFNYQNGHIWGF